MREKKKWIPDKDIILDDISYEIIRSDNNILVTAGPGAGKTEILAQKASYIFETSRRDTRILAISFKKDSASNLKERVILRCGSNYDDFFDSFTFAAFAKQLLDQYRKILPEKFQPDSNYILEDGVREIIKDFSSTTYNRTDRRTLKNVRQKLDSTNIEDLNVQGLKLWDHLINASPSKLTFPMITILVLYMIKESRIIRNIVSSSYDFVFLDEFQDTTTLQYELIRRIFINSGINIVAVGDEKQRIMVWAGADKEVFKKFTEDFNAKIKELMFNFRSAPKLIAFQLDVYNILNALKIEIGHNPKYGMEEGYITLTEFIDNNRESMYISSEIMRKISEGMSPKEICILTKQLPFEYTKDIIKILNSEGVYARVENDYQDLIKEPVVKLIISLLDILGGKTSTDSWILLSDYFEKIHKTGFNIINMIELDKRIIEIGKSNKSFNDVGGLLELINVITDLLDIQKLKTVYIEYSQGNYLADVISKFKDLYCNEYKRTSDCNILNLNSAFLGEYSIPIMTTHKSKGLEFTCVYFLGLEDSAFWSYKDDPMENKNTFFVALSRAKKEVHFTFSGKRLNFVPPIKPFICINQSHLVINEIYNLVLKHKMN